MKKYFLITGLLIIIVFIVATAILIYSYFGKNPQTQNNIEPGETGKVIKIIDPITIKLESGHIVRYVGVRNPDVVAEVRCFGKEALLANESMIGRQIRMEKESLINRSNDGAWVRYVFFDDPNAQKQQEQNESIEKTTTSQDQEKPEKKEIFVNERILEMGLGFPLVSKDMKYGERMLAASKYASATGKGLWSQCKVENKQTPSGTYFYTQKLEDCVIKGKITSQGEKIYRLPECPAYKETMVIQAEGGKWFCAQDTAVEEGFKKASDCPK